MMDCEVTVLTIVHDITKRIHDANTLQDAVKVFDYSLIK